MRRTARTLFLFAILAGLLFVLRDPLQNFLDRSARQVFPCTQPIAYAIGSFDSRFGISRDEFLEAVRAAEQIWEKPVAKNLFVYVPDKGDMPIDLVYDFRQEATEKLRELGLVVKDDKASYDALAAKYDEMVAGYDRKKAQFESRVVSFERENDAYNAEVARWNKKGGAPKDVYERLTAEKEVLEKEAADLTRVQDELNKSVEEINAFVVTLNRLAAVLNLNVARFNEIGEQRGGEFEAGSYQSGPDGARITIYEFEDREKLVRVLAHELGHALGLSHLEDPGAIMYRLNEGANEKLTAADVAVLRERCGI